MNIKEMIFKSKGLWLVELFDKTKWVLDLDKMEFDSYEWYKAVGTLENELVSIDEFMSGEWKRIELSENK